MNSKIKLVIFLVIISIAVAYLMKMRPNTISDEEVKEISPTFGSIQTTISTTGTIFPKNRLEIKPPVNGRIESILVREGEKVKTGQTLAWMSSTERAALLDAAQGQGQEKLNYWKEIYKPIALVASIDGEVIVATTQPGQTVTTADAVIVLSDHLIVRAQVDETDIGKIKLGQNAVVSIDAYPDTKIKATVEHIYYESKTVNNVTIYEVDLTPEEIPAFFRSGMNATIVFIENSKENVLLVPLEAVHREKDENLVLVKQSDNGQTVERPVKLGMADDRNVEVISGIEAKDKVIIRSKRYVLPKSDVGTNPFMPFRKKKESAGNK